MTPAGGKSRWWLAGYEAGKAGEPFRPPGGATHDWSSGYIVGARDAQSDELMDEIAAMVAAHVTR